MSQMTTTKSKTDLFLTMVYALSLALLVYAALHYGENEPDATLEIKVLKTEVDKARSLCHNKTQVEVTNSKGQHFRLPCSAVEQER